jgi:hypothetical protein
MSNGAGRRLFSHVRTCERVSLRRENRFPIVRSSHDEISLLPSLFSPRAPRDESWLCVSLPVKAGLQTRSWLATQGRDIRPPMFHPRRRNSYNHFLR